MGSPRNLTFHCRFVLRYTRHLLPSATSLALVNLSTPGEIGPDVSLSVDMSQADHRASVVRMQTEETETFIDLPMSNPCISAGHQPIAKATPLLRWVVLLVKCQRSGI